MPALLPANELWGGGCGWEREAGPAWPFGVSPVPPSFTGNGIIQVTWPFKLSCPVVLGPRKPLLSPAPVLFSMGSGSSL